MTMMEYYVDPSGGNDTTGNGTSGTPWKTVQKALDSITKNTTDGDRINVKDTADDVLTAELDFTSIGNYGLTYGLLIQGYTATAGDGGIGGISGGGTTSIISTDRSYIGFKDMHLHNTGANTILNISRGVLNNCEFNNSNSATDAVQTDESSVSNCHFHDLAAVGVSVGRGVVAGCYFEAGATYEMDTCIELGTSGGADRNMFSIDGATDAIYSLSAGWAFVTGNSILCNGGTGAGIRLENNVYVANVADNLVEGFSGAGGIGITKTSRDMSQYSNNSVYNCTTALVSDDFGIIAYGNETLGASPFTKSGADTRANRHTYFAPADVGSVLGGSTIGLDRGAVPSSGSGTSSPKHPLARF